MQELIKELKHFSHEEHPLSLIPPTTQVLEKSKVICYGCQKQIMEFEAAYTCYPCDFFLHKRCAELPRQITHPLHSQHPLLLHKNPTYSPHHICSCDGCGKENWAYFTYNCSLCGFDLEVSCAIFTYNCSLCEFDLEVSCAILEEERMLEHKSHEHPLILQRRLASFHCNACHTVEEDSSYICSSCSYWIHKRCALLPQTIIHKHHNHPLLLAFSIPNDNDYRSFEQECPACHQKVHPSEWVYYCGPCRYFVHIKCIVITNQPCEKGNDSVCNNEEENLIKLPSADAAQQLMFRSLLNVNHQNKIDQLEEVMSKRFHELQLKVAVISISDHEHPLTVSLMKVETADDEKIIGKEEVVLIYCDRCIHPISNSAPYYGCEDCSYFVHVTCLILPLEIQILNHPDHPLRIRREIRWVGIFRCDACRKLSNGHLYSCKPCELRVCVKCASAASTKTVAHTAHHKHLLTTLAANSNPTRCNACGRYFQGYGFGCEDCHFYLDYECTLLPPSAKLSCDGHHPLILIYPPYYEHPDEFYCVICEFEMNPNQWMYHCKECDYSCHVWCIREVRLFRNKKFGRKLCVDNHPHPLKHVVEADYKSFCWYCGKILDWEEAFECGEACSFYLCPFCAYYKELR